MRIVHLAFQYGVADTGGAAIAASQLHRALLACGVDSYYVCVHQRDDGECVVQLPGGWRRSVYCLLAKSVRCIWKFTPLRRSLCLNLVPLFGLKRVLGVIKPDVVHVHWISNDTCRFEQLGALPYRMVFHLHDMFMIAPRITSAVRINSGADFAKFKMTILEKWLYARKRKLITMKANAFIGPSEWVCQIARQSEIGHGIPARVISNLVAVEFFEHDAVCKRPVNDKFTLLFGAYNGRWNQFKGFDDLMAALEMLPREMRSRIRLMIFGEEGVPCSMAGIETEFLGIARKASELKGFYHVADLLVFPSVQETQGMVKIEAMLCGVPVVAFDRAACAEGIVHKITGWVARADDCGHFAEGISFFYGEWANHRLTDIRKREISEITRTHFDRRQIMSQVIAFYGDLIKQSLGV